jgi:hypothetical protein
MRMMKQLTIICSSEIARKVERVLSASGIRGFFHTQGTGTHVEKKGPYNQNLTWPADIFIVPAEEERLRPVIAKLTEYAGKCEIEPCLRMILVPVEEFH